MMMTEKIRGAWNRLPAWWPVGMGIVYLIWSQASWHQEINDRLKTVESQVVAIQEYLRHEHQKTAPNIPDVTGMLPSITKNQLQDAINHPHL